MLYLALALGGALGAITRYLLYQSTAYWETTFPYPTLMINLAGCLVLGFFFTLTLDYLILHPALRTGFGTGFVGAFTTFSTFSVENLRLLQQGELTLSLLYVLASLLGGLLCAGIGIHSARWLARRRLRG
ncbi:MAG TPA: fluoride efflux transporter CrcB [Paenibacillaceae bacterium]|nr:fluoride efflux transporter CrcB [Paenibacillaceae bacterium]